MNKIDKIDYRIVIFYRTLVSIVLLLSSFGIVYPDFDDNCGGARGVGMGNAGVALSDDAFGMFFNPAGLGFVKQAQIGAEYGRMWIGLNDASNLSHNIASIVLPLTKSRRIEIKKDKIINTINISSGTSFSESSISTTTSKTSVHTLIKNLGTIAIAWRSFSLFDYYTETAYSFTFSKCYNSRFSFGVTAKLLQERYVIDEYLKLSPVFDYGQRDGVSAFSVDAGVIYNLLPRFFIGVAAYDINQPSLGLAQTVSIPSTLKIGFAWKQSDIRWVSDVVFRSGNWYNTTGFEKILNKIFIFRGGFYFGGRNYACPCGGLSFNLNAVVIDYGFQFPLTGIHNTKGSHYLSLIYRFGRKPKEDIEPGSLEMYYSLLQEEALGLRKTLEETEAEKKKLEELLLEEATMRIRERIKAAKATAKDLQSSLEQGRSSQVVSKEQKEIQHIVQKGETLQSISEKYYGDSKYWNEIYQVNRENIGRGGILKENQTLIIPLLSKKESIVQESPFGRTTSQDMTKQGSTIQVPIKVITPQETGLRDIVPVKVVSQEQTKEVVSDNLQKSIDKNIQQKEKGQLEEIKPKVVTPSEKVLQKPSGPRKHIVQPGENLQSIAKKYYNDPSKWKDIYSANKNKIISGQVVPGQELIIP